MTVVYWGNVSIASAQMAILNNELNDEQFQTEQLLSHSLKIIMCIKLITSLNINHLHIFRHMGRLTFY